MGEIMTLSQRLWQLRLEANLTIKASANAAGLSVSYLYDLENGRTEPSLKALRKLSTAYGVTVVELLARVRWESDHE